MPLTRIAAMLTRLERRGAMKRSNPTGRLIPFIIGGGLFGAGLEAPRYGQRWDAERTTPGVRKRKEHAVNGVDGEDQR